MCNGDGLLTAKDRNILTINKKIYKLSRIFIYGIYSTEYVLK